MMRLLARLFRDSRAAAAAEMALVAPFLILLMFGSLEMGKYFWDEHIVVQAVRDGARFAARQSFASMPCDGTATNEDEIKNVVRFGEPQVTDGDQPRLYYWTNPATVTVSIDTCYDNSGTDGTRVYNGVYADRATVPIVTVSANVPYTPIVGRVAGLSSSLHLNASSEATVFGI